MKDMFRLDGKVAIVTGGAGGIGEALALGLGYQGATVVVSSRNQQAINAVAEKISAETGSEAWPDLSAPRENWSTRVAGLLARHNRDGSA